MESYLLNLLIYLAVFSAVMIFSYYLLPLIAQKIGEKHEGKLNKISQELRGLFIDISSHKLKILCLLIGVGGGILGFILFKFIGLAVAVILAFLFPLFLTKFNRGARKRKFSEQLADAIMVLKSGLKAGLSFNQALEMVTQDMPPPICQEFSLVTREIKMGLSLEDALCHLDKKLNIEEFSFVTSAILVAHKVGGNFPLVLDKLISTLRDRARLRENIRTYTLQGRAQGYIISFIPLVFLGIVLKQNPRHFDIMLSTDIGKALLTAAVILNIVGLFFIMKMSKIKI